MRLFTRGVFLTLLITLSAFSGFGQLTAHFTADVVAGCSPLVVHFSNTTTPTSGTTYDWDFGNSDPHSPLVSPSTTYITPGSYTVTLRATNGSSVSVYTMTIIVYPSPTVSFTANDTSICPGTSVTFTSTSVGGVPGPVTCTWSFGDGFSGSGTVVSHTYIASGWYNVTLSCTNADGCVASLTKTTYIHVFTPASPNFAAVNAYLCGVPGHAVFNNLTTGTGPFTYLWRFGDGGTSTSASPTHDYGAPGTYNVTLIVTDGNGCTDSIVVPAYITVGTINAAFTLPATACVGTWVLFPNTSSAHISSQWYYGDGSSSTTDMGSHVYTTPGVDTVTLIIFDGHCYDTVKHAITILPGPAASFIITPGAACPPPSTITVIGSVPGGTGVTWLFGDGGTGSGTTASHTYYRRGVFDIEMISVDPSTGCRDTVRQTDTIYDMVFTITATPDHGCKPLTVTFTTNAVTHEPDTTMTYPYPWPFTSYSWTFGDGGTGSGATTTHVYTAVGTYYAHVTAVTANGCIVTDSVLILVGQPPVATFTAAPTHLCYHNNHVIFTSTTVVGPIDEWVWQFGDGTGETDSIGSVDHAFVLPGIFSATLTPYYHGCPGPPVVLTGTIIIDSPMAVIAAHVLCSPVNRVVFGDSSLGDDTHVWQFGDGTTSTLDNPIHDYASAIVYTVTLSTYNVRSGCRDTAVKLIDLHRPTVTFTCGDTAICRDSIAVMTATVTGGVASGYMWHSSGWSPDSTSAVYIDTFHVRGIFPVRLIIVDQNGCLDTTIRNNYIHVAKPIASFTVSPPTGCWPLTTTFTDASSDIAGTFYTSFAWDFGDGGSTVVTTPSVTHTYVSAGTFTTTEIVTDNIGCKDTVALSLVTVYRPHAVFSATNVHPCAHDSIQFLNTSTGIVSSFWMFGDGGTSSLNSPWHAYASAGVYTVKLVVTDSHGCHDTATYLSYINVTQPVASFYMDDSVSICPPLTVHFFNTSTGGIFYNWDLGDGSSSTLIAPTDLYIATGYDTIRLIVTNNYGCRDTAWGHVNIFGYAGAFSYAPLSGCEPLTVYFHATTLNVPNIIWDFSDGNTSVVSYSDTISHTYTLPGAYIPKLILSDNSGCQNSSLGKDTIKIDQVTASFKTVPNPVCLGDTFTLVDSSTSYWSTITSWSWTFNGNTSTLPSPSFYIGTVGTYPTSLTVTDGWGCTAIVNSDVNVYPPPVITVSPDTLICVGDAAVLTGYGGVSYTWSPAATLSCTACNPTHASPPVVTQYTVTGTDAHGCKNWDTTTVLLRTNTISVARGDTEICAGVSVPLYDSGGTRYTWIPGLGLNNASIADPIATPALTTKYMVIAQLAGCIPDTNWVIVTVHPIPTVDAGPDQTLLEGSTAQLETKSWMVSKYMWDNTGSLSCDSCANPVASMSVTTTYTVHVFSDFGCENADSVTIHIYCDASQIFVPNSFTPNNDGQNDVFYPRGQGISVIKSFRIYNRWGQLLFERSGININDASNAWDGSFQGGAPRPDVYVWVIDALCETGAPINIKGDVTIIR